MAAIDYAQAGALLAELFGEAEQLFAAKTPPAVAKEIAAAGENLFRSTTQSYREVLLGCALARLLDATINIRHPYMNQGEDAFNGRTLDERVVNPFLQDRMIPCSKGPYLAVFRRSVNLTPETAGGLRDKDGYTAMMVYIDALEAAKAAEARALTIFLLYGFAAFRDAATIPLSKISRLSLEQYADLIGKLLQVQSGGLIPVLLVVAMLRTIKACFGLQWDVQSQGINVADKASGAGGDVTVTEGGNVLLAIEVTERPIDKSRVVATFNTKIVRAGIADYLFVYANAQPEREAREAARTYFSQGHEINFLHVQDWIVNNLGTIGARCRNVFTQEMIGLLDTPQVPAKVKVAWNDIVKAVVGV